MINSNEIPLIEFGLSQRIWDTIVFEDGIIGQFGFAMDNGVAEFSIFKDTLDATVHNLALVFWEREERKDFRLAVLEGPEKGWERVA